MAEEEEVQVPEEQTEETDERWFVAPKTLVEMPTKPASDAVTFDAQNDDDTELFLFSFPQNVCSSIHIPPCPASHPHDDSHAVPNAPQNCVTV